MNETKKTEKIDVGNRVLIVGEICVCRRRLKYQLTLLPPL